MFSAIVGKDDASKTEQNDLYKCIAYVLADGKCVYLSGEITIGDAQTFTLDISGVKELTLGVIDCGVFGWLTVDFCDACLYKGELPPAEKYPAAQDIKFDDAKYLSDMTYTDCYTFGGDNPGIDKDVLGGDIVISSERYDKGISLLPPMDDKAYIKYDVSAFSDQYSLFYAVCGKDDFSKNISRCAEISVFVDGEQAASSGSITYGDKKIVCVDISGAKELALYAASMENSDSWAVCDFGDACLLNSQIAEIELVSSPYKTEYLHGGKLNPYGGLLRVSFENGISCDVNVTEKMLSGFDPDKSGEQTVTISYRDQTFEYKVTVAEERVPKTESPSATATDDETADGIKGIKIAIIVGILLLIVIAVIIFIAMKIKKSKRRDNQ